ncbi:Uncharacterised protein [Salmonella enterica subsp. enterica]|nr:Uncharacterised protein [Salmonella enterica subsp. enterica]
MLALKACICYWNAVFFLITLFFRKQSQLCERVSWPVLTFIDLVVSLLRFTAMD